MKSRFSFTSKQAKELGDSIISNYVQEALLKYRRENRIFEVGDDVVFEGEHTLTAIFKVETLTHKTGKPKTLSVGRWGNFPVGRTAVRHATDEEIKEGRRL